MGGQGSDSKGPPSLISTILWVTMIPVCRAVYFPWSSCELKQGILKAFQLITFLSIIEQTSYDYDLLAQVTSIGVVKAA